MISNYIPDMTSRKIFFGNLLRKSVINEIVDDRCSEKKNVNEGSFILHQHQVVYKHQQNFSLTNSETKHYLKIKLCTGGAFPKINWNLERGPLKVTTQHLEITNKAL